MMAIYQLKNSKLSISVDSQGAELKSMKDMATGTEYMWDADPAYWKRTAPVLFPLVGSLNKGRYRYNGREYAMSQHGFARDMEFALVRQTKEELLFGLEGTEETYAKYPFRFRLEIGYRLNGNERTVTVSWKVINTDDKEMYFSIGGHPAFLCPLHAGETQTDCKILFDAKESLTSSVIGGGGTLSSGQKEYPLQDGYLNITEDLFDNDALIIENHQAHQVSLCGADGKPYLTVSFDAPLFGVWSPVKKNAPFICIEPWYGRCDREDFEGDLSEREWGNQLAASEEFCAEYTIGI